MVLVASPSAIGKMPVASGSSVPPCPIFCAFMIRRTFPTAWVDVIPAGLSSAIQPLITVPLRFIFNLFLQGNKIRRAHPDVPGNFPHTELAGFIKRIPFYVVAIVHLRHDVAPGLVFQMGK